ncbi:hypothetical protein JCM16358_02130 [Halanaerocella petrolearia]
MDREECILNPGDNCNDCGECLICDLNSNKECDNCMECIEGDSEFRAIKIDDVVYEE